MVRDLGPPKLVHRCMVWYRPSVDNGLEQMCDDTHRRQPLAIPSKAYGSTPERDTIDEAMRDMVALKLTSMKHSPPDGIFYCSVVTYVDGEPPMAHRRTIYLEMGG